MTASRPPPALSRRPWYVTAALLAAWICGAQAMSDGWDALSFFRGERPDVHAFADAVTDLAAHDLVAAAGDRWIALREAANAREMPVGGATLLLGTVMLLCAFRAMAGSEGARSTLIQVLVVYAGVGVVAFLLFPEVARAQVEFHLLLGRGLARAYGDPTPPEIAEATPIVLRVLPSLVLALRTLFCALLVLALTRPRARAFFHGAARSRLGDR